MKVIVSLLILLIAAGCVTRSEEYSNYLDSFVGKKKKILVKNFGVPSKAMELDDDEEMLLYHDVKGGFVVGHFMEYRQCKTQFTLKDNVVTDWEWNGDC